MTDEGFVSDEPAAEHRTWTPNQIPPSIRAAAGWSWRLLLIGALIAAIGWLFAYLMTIIVPVAIALLVTVLLAPLHGFLRHRAHLPNALAVAVAVIGLLAVVGGLIFVAGHQLYVGFSQLTDQAIAGINEVRRWLADGPLGIDNDQLNTYWQQVQSAVTGGTGLSTIATGALGVAATAGHVLVGILITIFCTIFFLGDGKTIWTWLVRLLPTNVREVTHQAGRRGLASLSAYVRTQILVALIDAIGIGAGSAFFVPQLAVPIGVLVFVGSFIPVVGAVVTGTIACVVVLVSHGWPSALVMLAIVLLVQQVESHGLQPFLMGHAVSLHPVAVVLAVAAGSMAAGIVGALFAVPLVATLNTVILYLHGHDKFPELGGGDRVPLWRSKVKLRDLSLPAITGSIRRVRGNDSEEQQVE
ncbi:MAG: AI-2E family transporter [Cellulomonadaceae bacterium]|jgi:predicted PurR-regulated permease PerM|nr:AI-2E family transporter [Cellulomonadaceae bacterium]